ncbi:probable peptidyl-tRNA hydrolase [Dunckerocampus dactyliophorus]|uniref:probable peptidyl-tRNA hydrolase n=1 Tax=Dunckerocampus dactyliophorus TaxID=161453 RepID=UPI0024051078|nr:probable peptidyl-tRNA hydrolase [Dunckerocampus dactyliophorus]
MMSSYFLSLFAFLSWRFISRGRYLGTMQRCLTRIVSRVWPSESWTASSMSTEAPALTQGRSRMMVGLGNPGMEATRHSVGMAVLGALAARLGLGERWHGDKQVCGDVIVSEMRRTRLVLLRPKVLMNVNGVSVAKAASKYGVRPEDIVLVHDELDKPLGKMSIKHGGSARGHNGVRSCVACLHSDVMLRLRVGIGRPAGTTSVDRHVLGRFTWEERKVLDAVLVQGVDLLLSQLSQEEEGQSSSSTSPAGCRRGHARRRDA